MTRVSLFTILLAGTLLIVGCSQAETSIPSASASPAVPSSTAPFISRISTQEAFTLIQQNRDNPDFVILDVRTAAEYAEGHIAGSINIDYYAESFKTDIGQLDRNRQYLVYCRTARRSALAAEIMLGLGFTRILDMSGGIVQWTQDGYPTVK